MLHLAETAPFIARQSEITARDLVADVLSELPDADRSEQFKLFQEMLTENHKYQRSVDWYFFSAIASYLDGSRHGIRPHRTSEQKAQTERVVSNAVEAVKLSILNLIMPNGKPARDCTGTEMGRFGAGYSLIAKRVGTKIVGKVLSESEIRKLM